VAARGNPASRVDTVSPDGETDRDDASHRFDATVPTVRRSGGAGVTRTAVIGTGSWGTAFSMVLADAGTDVVLWGRRDELCRTITTTHENPAYLPGVPLPKRLLATSDAAEALDGAAMVVVAVPSQLLRDNLAKLVHLLPDDAVLVSLMKGIELGSAKRMTEVLQEVAGVPQHRVAAVSGPNLAREIAVRQPAAAVGGVHGYGRRPADPAQLHHAVLPALHQRRRGRVRARRRGEERDRPRGRHGRRHGFGDNARASIITAGSPRPRDSAPRSGADPQTFAGLAGLGDLVATVLVAAVAEPHVRREPRQRHERREAAAATNQTAEGVISCESVLELARRAGVVMPIVEAVVGVVRDGMAPREMVAGLMTRATKAEDA
jgi:glycerol-3-phosphate dehydrogenase (NAD(P)+)